MSENQDAKRGHRHAGDSIAAASRLGDDGWRLAPATRSRVELHLACTDVVADALRIHCTHVPSNSGEQNMPGNHQVLRHRCPTSIDMAKTSSMSMSNAVYGCTAAARWIANRFN
ncbi:hypothetical protein [Xanthomonas vasicola]|uniref:hypothetical protein n=1 Tax=Xanthomonas vasicola TaxID=56459 RepID=UPI0003483981|nr:hypothetical protein [Xanthomonas vasicola]